MEQVGSASDGVTFLLGVTVLSFRSPHGEMSSNCSVKSALKIIPLFCIITIFIADKCAESKKLITSLVDVAEVDFQVAFTLLRMCGGYCTLVHITRVTPPSLASYALVSFDEDVRQCFVLCSAIEVSDTAWKQAQFSLRFGGFTPLLPCRRCLYCLAFLIRPGPIQQSPSSAGSHSP